MAPINTERDRPIWQAIGVIMAVLVTVTVCIRVSKHWQAYESFDRFFAIVVLLALAIFPGIAIWSEKKSGRGLELFHVYLLILMVMSLFR
jgi:hypothetical protein